MFIMNSFHYFCVAGLQVVNVPLIWINHINKILLLGNINYDNKFPLHIVTQTIMNWTLSLSCYNWIDLKIFFLTPCTYCWRMCEVVPCLVNLSFTFLVLVFRDDMFELLQRYHVGTLNPEKGERKMVSHDPILSTWMVRNHFNNSCEVNCRTTFEIMWIEVGYGDTHLLISIIVVNNSTSLLLVFKMKLPTQMCHFFSLGCTLCMATALEVYSCHDIRETSCHIVLKDLHPPLGNPQTYHNCSPSRKESKSLESLILSFRHFTNSLVKQWNPFPPHDSPSKTLVPFLRCWFWKPSALLAKSMFIHVFLLGCI